ncbi:phosphate ABC transporter permease family protein, partial [Acinetobacter baumannii]
MNLLLIGVLLALVAIAYQLGLRKSRHLAGKGSNSATLHSRPGYYGALVGLWCGIPAFLILIIWNLVEPSILNHIIFNNVPASVTASLDEAARSVLVDRVQAIASGFGVSDHPAAYELAAAQQYAKFQTIGSFAKFAVVVCAALLGLVWAKKKISQEYRARNQVERAINVGLILCSGVAILTTIGIVMSMFGEAMHFFHFVSPIDFFFGTEWNPGFSTSGNAEGSYGLLPLLWGTLMVSGIALL